MSKKTLVSKRKEEHISSSDSKRLIANGGLYLIEPSLKLNRKKSYIRKNRTLELAKEADLSK